MIVTQCTVSEGEKDGVRKEGKRDRSRGEGGRERGEREGKRERGGGVGEKLTHMLLKQSLCLA